MPTAQRHRCGALRAGSSALSDRGREGSHERVLSGEELERLIGVADDRYRSLIAFAAGTGARLGETLGLKWRSLDLDRGTASITHQLDRQGRYAELKTARSRRTVELPASLVSLLRARKLEVPYSGDNDYVFTTRQGGPLEHRNVGGRALSRAVERAGLEADGQAAPTFHALRHGFASAWIASGGDLVELSAHLGHRDPSITASTYSHEFEKAARSDARRARLDAMFGGSLATTAVRPPEDDEEEARLLFLPPSGS